MKLDLSKKQYECLIKAVETAGAVYGTLSDVSPAYKKQSAEVDDLQYSLLGHAAEFGAGKSVQVVVGKTVLADKLADEVDAALDEYDDDTFWFELETRLGQRDFDRTATAAEKKAMKAEGCYPERISDIYDALASEFDAYGLNRVEISKKK